MLKLTTDNTKHRAASLRQLSLLLKWQPSAIFHFKNFHICFCHPVPNVLLHTKFHQNRTISGFSRWRISAILNFMGRGMKSPCRTSYRSIKNIALNCLVFLRKSRFCVRILATDKRTNRQTSQHQRVKQLTRYRERRLD